MKKAYMLILILATMLFFTNSLSAATPSDGSTKKTGNWLIYCYICGSDLESGSNNNSPAQATKDMEEMLNFTFEAIEEITAEESPYQYNYNSSGRGRDITPVKDNQKEIKLNEAVKKSVMKKFPAYIDKETSEKFPPNVKILIQTGGAMKWFVSDIPSNTISRYVFDNRGVHYQGSFADADMGDATTLADFLQYGKDTVEKDFQPNHRIFIFWNHGGLAGVCYDERDPVDNSFLNLNDINAAFAKVYKPSPNNPPFEIVGFDACIRATYENADNLYGFARYMVASEENESDHGWYYTDWIRQLGKYPSMSGKDLGQLICKSSFERLKKLEEQGDNTASPSEATFSVIELSPAKWLPVRIAYNNFGKNILNYTNENPYMYGALDKIATAADHYSVGPDNNGYTLDLMSFAEGTNNLLYSDFESALYDFSEDTKKSLSKNADDLIKAIDAAVVFNVAGENKSRSKGLAVHYPLNKNSEELTLYAAQRTAPDPIKELYRKVIPNLPPDLSVNGNQSRNTSARSSNTSNKKITFNEIFDLSDLAACEITLDEDENKVSVQLTKDQMRKIADIRCLLALGLNEYMDEDNPAYNLFKALNLDEEGGALLLGESNNVKSVWNKSKDICTVSENFEASWIMFNHNLVFAAILETRNDVVDSKGNIEKYGYTTYGIPLLINDKEGYLLRVVYHHDTKQYQIVGARESVKGVGRTNRGFTQLKPGDKITPMFLFLGYGTEKDQPGSDGVIYKISDGENIFVMKYVWDDSMSFRLENEQIIEKEPLKNGEYGYWFEYVNPQNKPAFSGNTVVFNISDGEIDSSEKIDSAEYNPQQLTFESEDKKAVVDMEKKEIEIKTKENTDANN